MRRVSLGFFCGGTALCHLCYSNVSGGWSDSLWVEAGIRGGGDVNDTGGMGGFAADLGAQDGATGRAAVSNIALACDFFTNRIQGDYVSAFSFFNLVGV